MKQKSWRTGMVGSLLLLVVVSSCSEKEQGIAESQKSSTSVSSESSVTTPTSPEPASSSIDPCDLLTAEDLAEVGKFESEYDEGAGARSCRWQNTFENGGEGFTFGVNVRDGQSVDTVNDNGLGVQQTQVNQRPAAVAKNVEFRSCTFAMKIDDVSRVDVTVPGTDQDDACKIAEVIAGMVEPNLPELP